MSELSLAMLSPLFHEGFARVPTKPGISGAEAAGLVWRVPDSTLAVATPTLLRLAQALPTPGESAALVAACEPRLREPWLELEAARLGELGRRGATAALCDAIDIVGGAAGAIRPRVRSAQLSATTSVALELELFGAAADQPMAALPLRRVLGATASIIEGGRGQAAPVLAPVHPKDAEANWVPGRLLQAPSGTAEGGAVEARVLTGGVGALAAGQDRMTWVLGTPWITLLSVLVFTAEAWAAERHGGLQLELPMEHIASFGAPPRVNVVVTLADGREVICGSLGELCLRVLDALRMAIVPSTSIASLDAALAPVVAILLRAGVWVWQAHARPRYVISDDMSFDCYRGEGHRYICRGAERLAQMLRSVAGAWARTRLGDASAGGAT